MALVIQFAAPILKLLFEGGQIRDVGRVVKLILLSEQVSLELVVAGLDFVNHDLVAGF